MSKRDRINILKADRDVYKEINSRAVFKQASNSMMFMLAVGLGFRSGERKPFGRKAKDGFVILSSFPRKYEALIKALAVTVSGVEILADSNELYLIAEEYANAGIDVIRTMVGDRSEEIIGELERIMIDSLS